MKDGAFSPFTIEALVEVISGGPGLGSTDPPIGLYRTGPEIEGFLMGCGIDPIQAAAADHACLCCAVRLRWAVAQPNGEEMIRRAIERVADPRNHRHEPEKTQAVMEHLNLTLRPDTPRWARGRRDRWRGAASAPRSHGRRPIGDRRKGYPG